MKQPRILLLEDDSRIALLIELALEGLAIQLVHCATVPEAEQEFRKGPVTLFITDLMLPGEPGLSFLERLPAVPGYSPAMLTLAFSAGLTPDVRAKLDTLGVWRVMSKPASMAALRACVEEAILEAEANLATRPAGGGSPQSAAATPSPAHVEEFFDGDRSLFELFQQRCRAQFSRDIADGDAALDERDLAGLGRLAHSLATILETLGAPGAATLARKLEAACGDADAEAARTLWPTLRRQLNLSP